MSVVYAEGLYRQPLGVIPNGRGIVNRAVDVVVVSNATYPLSVVSMGGRRWLTTPNAAGVNEFPANSQCCLRIIPSSAAIDEARRANPGLPPLTNVARTIVSWKVSWNGQAIQTGNSNYLAQVGNQILTFSISAGNYAQLAGKGYFPLELVHDRRARRAELYCNGVLVDQKSNIVGGDEIRLGLLGLRTIPGGVIKGGQTWLTDIVVVYDDGIAPFSRIGDVKVVDSGIDFVTPRSPDVEVVGPSDITSTDLNAGSPNIKLVGDGTVDLYAPEENQPYLTADGTILAMTVEEARVAGSPIPGDLETSIVTPLGTTSKVERPTTLLQSLQSTIRSFSKPITVKTYKTDVRVRLKNKAR